MKFKEIALFAKVLATVIFFLASLLIEDASLSQVLAALCIVIGSTIIRSHFSHPNKQEHYEEAK